MHTGVRTTLFVGIAALSLAAAAGVKAPAPSSWSLGNSAQPAPAADARGDTPEFYYMYKKERIPLRLDSSRAAIFSPPGERQEGAQTITGTPFPIAGWRMVSLDAPADAESVSRLASATAEFVSPVFFDSEGGDVLVTRNVLVRFREGVSNDAAREALRSVRAEIVTADFGGLSNFYRARVKSASGFDVLAAANTLAQRPDVEFAEPNRIVTMRPLQFIPNDEHFSRCWGLHAKGQNIIEGLVLNPPLPPVIATPDFDIDAPEAWKIETGDPSVIVVVFDQGVQLDHPDLMIDPALGRDFTTGVPGGIPGGHPVTPCDNHGTPVAGVIGAKINNKIGGCGVAPHARVASARIIIADCESGEYGEVEWQIEGLAWAISIGARITNHSYSCPPSDSFHAMINLTRKTMLHFGSGGNDGIEGITYPARLPEFFGVVSTHPVTAEVSDSNYGPELDACAPGIGILTTDRTGPDGYPLYLVDDDYIFMQGSSFAAPMAAGVAALVFSATPSMTPDEIDVLLRRSCIDMGDPGWDPMHGHGHINAHRAVAWAVCPADMNVDGETNSEDFYIFLDAFFALDPQANCNNDGFIDSQDFFDFLQRFFDGCP